jgi:G:T/U-mismatch repair DNA glycosylase
MAAFIDRLPALEAVAFNGRTAALHGRRQIGLRPGLVLIDLPSSSGAFASMSREAKRSAWMAMAPHIGDA